MKAVEFSVGGNRGAVAKGARPNLPRGWHKPRKDNIPHKKRKERGDRSEQEVLKRSQGEVRPPSNHVKAAGERSNKRVEWTIGRRQNLAIACWKTKGESPQ